MRRCKFCGVAENELDRRGAAAHINRDNLCNACYQLIRTIKEKRPCSLDDRLWFDKMCKLNMSIGRFVPLEQRRQLKAAAMWQCKECGTFMILQRDEHYTNYCIKCATAIRQSREMPAGRKRRSDRGSKHRTNQRLQGT